MVVFAVGKDLRLKTFHINYFDFFRLLYKYTTARRQRTTTKLIIFLDGANHYHNHNITKLDNPQVMTEPQICTYVLRLDCLGLNVTSEEVQRKIQSSIGSEHEVMHVDRMQFESTTNRTLTQDVVKIKSPDPYFVARKLMGDDWTRTEHVVFRNTGRPTIL